MKMSETAPWNPGAPQSLTHRQAKATVKSMRPWWKKKRFWSLGAIGLFIVSTVAGSAAKNSGKVAPPAQLALTSGLIDDARVVSCEVDSITWAKSRIRVTNNSSKASDYYLTVHMTAPNGDLWDTAYATIDGLAPGQTTTESAQSLKPDAPTGLACSIVDVLRTRSMLDPKPAM